MKIVNIVKTCRIAGQGRIPGNNAVAASGILGGKQYVGMLVLKGKDLQPPGISSVAHRCVCWVLRCLCLEVKCVIKHTFSICYPDHQSIKSTYFNVKVDLINIKVVFHDGGQGEKRLSRPPEYEAKQLSHSSPPTTPSKDPSPISRANLLMLLRQVHGFLPASLLSLFFSLLWTPNFVLHPHIFPNTTSLPWWNFVIIKSYIWVKIILNDPSHTLHLISFKTEAQTNGTCSGLQSR